MGRLRLLLGINVFWLALSMLFDGINTLVLPNHLTGFTSETSRATVLGLLTFAGLMAGMLVQPVADAFRFDFGRHRSFAWLITSLAPAGSSQPT